MAKACLALRSGEKDVKPEMSYVYIVTYVCSVGFCKIFEGSLHIIDRRNVDKDGQEAKECWMGGSLSHMKGRRREARAGLWAKQKHGNRRVTR